jgi:hypothetical protein
MSNQDLPVANPENFLGECSTMDLSELKNKLFMISINSGDREKGKFICETLHGPYEFLEMVEEVDFMWKEDLHHAKVYVLSKDRSEPAQWLDLCTIDYIEARAGDIITDAFVEGTLGVPDCKAGLRSGRDEDPRLKAKEEADGKEEED